VKPTSAPFCFEKLGIASALALLRPAVSRIEA
jgi:hypothetical protein